MATAQDFDQVVEYVLGCTPHPKSHQKWQYHINGRLIGWCMRSHGWRKSTQLTSRTISDMALEMKCSSGMWKSLLDGQAELVDYLDELMMRGIIDQQERNTGLREYEAKRRP